MTTTRTEAENLLILLHEAQAKNATLIEENVRLRDELADRTKERDSARLGRNTLNAQLKGANS